MTNDTHVDRDPLTLVGGGPERPEPKAQPIVWLTLEQIVKQERWTEAQLATVFNLPDGVCRFPSPSFRRARGYRVVNVWRADAVDVWKQKVREHIALLQKLVK
jgi:hypothetical protein